jgi:transcription elongation factor Elf1
MDQPSRRRSRFSLRRRKARNTGLETCPLCGRDFVNPVAWEPADASHWWMLLRCGECDAWQEITVSDAEAQRFDVELDRRADVLARAAARLDRQRMAADVETMIAALRRGLIDAADFSH